MSGSVVPVEMGAHAGADRPRILVAGIGNIFFGDDAFGVEVAGLLRDRRMPDGVRVVDFGIRGLHLAYELLDGFDLLVLVDAMPLGAAPGTVVLFEPDAPTASAAPDPTQPSVDAHAISPAVVLGTLEHLGGSVDRVVVVGCQPAVVDQGIGLSAEVVAALIPAVELIDEVIADARAGPHRSETPT